MKLCAGQRTEDRQTRKRADGPTMIFRIGKKAVRRIGHTGHLMLGLAFVLVFFFTSVTHSERVIEPSSDSLTTVVGPQDSTLPGDTSNVLNVILYNFPEFDTTFPPYEFRPVTNLAFGVGETLKFSLGWEKIVAGHAEVTIPEVVEHRGRTCFRARSTARSTRFFSTFFKVEDWAESIFDAREIISLHFEKHLREGKYKSDRTVDFYPEAGVAATQTDTCPVPPYVQDALSLLYYVRTQPLNVGDTLYVDNFSKNKSYSLEVRVVKRERIQVKAGTFNTIVVEPLLQAAGLFKHKGRLKVWLTDDRLRMPVLMKSKVIVGSIVAELEEYKLGRLARY